IRIPPEQVGPIVAALGAARELREPDEIFAGILDEGEEVALVSGLKLCRKVVHREPVIELIGVDPHRFAEIRSLGLINEQIDWKQRFFVPTDEETGIPTLTELLSRYPVLASDVLADEEPTEIEPAELIPQQIVNLDEWFVTVAMAEPTGEPESALALETRPKTCFRGYDSPHALRPRAERGTSGLESGPVPAANAPAPKGGCPTAPPLGDPQSATANSARDPAPALSCQSRWPSV